MFSITDHLIVLYTFVDDFLIAHPHLAQWRTSHHAQPKFADAEVITIAMMQGYFNSPTLKLKQRFTATRPDAVWTTDITYVPTAEGWVYVAAVKDLYAGEIVGRSFGSRMTTELIVRALQQAVTVRRPARGLVHHSERGAQYCSHEYQALLRRYGMRASMSRRGNCYDNAPVESFCGTLKMELVHHRRYATRVEAMRETTEYIDLFYNRERRQARLGYLSPAAYTQQFRRQQHAA